MRKKDFLSKSLVMALMGCAFTLTAQNPFEMWYPTLHDRTVRDVLRMSDGNYLLGGMSNVSDPTENDAYVIKTDRNGTFIKDALFGGTGQYKVDYIYSMVATGDGNYIAVGYSASYGGGDIDMYFLKFDGDLNAIKSDKISLGGFNFDEAREIIKTADGNYAVVGTSGPSSNRQIAIVKIDGNGTVLWSKFHGGPANDWGLGIKECTDGGFIVAGQITGTDGDAYLLRTNSSGDKVWDKTWSKANDQEAVGVVVLGNGNYIAAVRDSSSSDIDVTIVGLSADGQTELFTPLTYSGSEKDTPKTIELLSDGNVIVGAISRSFNAFKTPDMWLLKINSADGTKIWEKFYGGGDHEHCHRARQDPQENAILAAGHTRSVPSDGQAVYFLKLNADGELQALSAMASDIAGIGLFPNPSRGSFEIDMNRTGTYKILVSNLLGETVFSKNFDSTSRCAVDLTNCSSGVYLVSVQSGSGKTVTKKLVLN